ncbi:MAG: S-layer homology domain-containing protein [Evtepia sp.]
MPDSHWAAASIQSAKTYGLMSGMTSKTFGLGQTITRAQFVTVTARMLGWDTKTTTASGFADTKGHWAEGAISAAVQHGALDKGELPPRCCHQPRGHGGDPGPRLGLPVRGGEGRRLCAPLHRCEEQQGLCHRGL